MPSRLRCSACLRYAVFVVLASVALPWSVLSQSPSQPSPAELDALVSATVQTWKVPGAAVAIVRGDKVLLAKGYGLRDLENKKPTTPRTLFRLASTSKSFTAATVAALVSQGKLDWNTEVRKYFPEFQLHNNYLTAQVTPVDLLSHRTGLPRHDALWYFNRDFTRQEMVARLRHLEPNKPLRETFQYNNLMYMTAGYLAGRALNTSWEKAVRRLLFMPLGMGASSISIEALERSRDYALPYQKDKQDAIQPSPPFRSKAATAPAGAINSNAEEMARYLSMLMNGGVFEGRQVLAKADVQKMSSAQMVVGPADPRYPELGDSAYGLGLFITTYRGQRMVHHGGANEGYRANLAYLPEQKIGVVVLSNLGGVNFPTALTYELFDRMLGVPDGGWSQRYLDDERKSKAAQGEVERKGYTGRKSGTQPSHPLADYVGHYQHPGYGTVRIEQTSAGLSIQYGFLNTVLPHFHYDSFEFIPNPVSQSTLPLRFETGDDGEIASLSVPMESLLPPIVFNRIADPQMHTREFLAPFAGRYELGPSTVEIVLREDLALKLVQPNGQAFELQPSRGTTFLVKERAAWKLEFKRAPDGSVSEAVLHQPSNSSVLKRKP